MCVDRLRGCGGSVTRNLTHVQSPSYPGSYLPDTSTTCTYTFTKVNTRVCQVRLDFVEFVLGPPISTNVVSAADCCSAPCCSCRPQH